MSDDPRVLNFLFQFDEFASPDQHYNILMVPGALSSPWLQQSVTAIGELFVIYPGFDIPYEMLVFVQQVVNFLKSTKSSYVPKSVKECWISLEFRFMVERITYWALTFMDDRIGDSNRIRQNNPTTKLPNTTPLRPPASTVAPTSTSTQLVPPLTYPMAQQASLSTQSATSITPMMSSTPTKGKSVQKQISAKLAKINDQRSLSKNVAELVSNAFVPSARSHRSLQANSFNTTSDLSTATVNNLDSNHNELRKEDWIILKWDGLFEVARVHSLVLRTPKYAIRSMATVPSSDTSMLVQIFKPFFSDGTCVIPLMRNATLPAMLHWAPSEYFHCFVAICLIDAINAISFVSLPHGLATTVDTIGHSAILASLKASSERLTPGPSIQKVNTGVALPKHCACTLGLNFDPLLLERCPQGVDLGPMAKKFTKDQYKLCIGHFSLLPLYAGANKGELATHVHIELSRLKRLHPHASFDILAGKCHKCLQQSHGQGASGRAILQSGDK